MMHVTNSLIKCYILDARFLLSMVAVHRQFELPLSIVCFLSSV